MIWMVCFPSITDSFTCSYTELQSLRFCYFYAFRIMKLTKNACAYVTVKSEYCYASTPYTLFPGCTFKTYEKRSQHENWETIS